jgi:hypothetical protein
MAVTHKIASQKEKNEMDPLTKEDPAGVPQITDNRHHNGSINMDKWKTYV